MLGHLGSSPYDDEPAPPLFYFHSVPEAWVRPRCKFSALALFPALVLLQPLPAVQAVSLSR